MPHAEIEADLDNDAVTRSVAATLLPAASSAMVAAAGAEVAGPEAGRARGAAAGSADDEAAELNADELRASGLTEDEVARELRSRRRLTTEMILERCLEDRKDDPLFRKDSRSPGPGAGNADSGADSGANAGEDAPVKVGGRALTGAQMKALLGSARLRLDGLGVTRIDSLEAFAEATHLYLQRNDIDLMEGLDGLAALRFLCLAGNRIAAIEGLEELDALQLLDLRDNRIADLDGAYLPDGLRRLFLAGNPCASRPGYREVRIGYLRVECGVCSVGLPVCASHFHSSSPRSPPPAAPFQLIISSLPELDELDGVPVTAAERAKLGALLSDSEGEDGDHDDEDEDDFEDEDEDDEDDAEEEVDHAMAAAAALPASGITATARVDLPAASAATEVSGEKGRRESVEFMRRARQLAKLEQGQASLEAQQQAVRNSMRGALAGQFPNGQKAGAGAGAGAGAAPSRQIAGVLGPGSGGATTGAVRDAGSPVAAARISDVRAQDEARLRALLAGPSMGSASAAASSDLASASARASKVVAAELDEQEADSRSKMASLTARLLQASKDRSAQLEKDRAEREARFKSLQGARAHPKPSE